MRCSQDSRRLVFLRFSAETSQYKPNSAQRSPMMPAGVGPKTRHRLCAMEYRLSAFMIVSCVELRNPFELCFSLHFSRQGGNPDTLGANLFAEETHYFRAPGAGVYGFGNLREALFSYCQELFAGG